jgi:hypothetical protein
MLLCQIKLLNKIFMKLFSLILLVISFIYYKVIYLFYFNFILLIIPKAYINNIIT